MKAIVSHNINHITVFKHLFKDPIIPKFMTRMHIELFNGKITTREYLLRRADFFKNKWQNMDELINYPDIDFHDRFFRSFNTWLDWDMWLIGHLKSNDMECVNFEAIKEPEKP